MQHKSVVRFPVSPLGILLYAFLFWGDGIVNITLSQCLKKKVVVGGGGSGWAGGIPVCRKSVIRVQNNF